MIKTRNGRSALAQIGRFKNKKRKNWQGTSDVEKGTRETKSGDPMEVMTLSTTVRLGKTGSET